MLPVLDNDALREADRHTIEDLGVLGLILMENAATGLVDALRETWPEARRVLILCGRGNNGGDGLAVARHLVNGGHEVDLFLVADPETLTSDAKTNLAWARAVGLEVQVVESDDLEALENHLLGSDPPDVIIDALLGTGLDRPLAGRLARVVDMVNRCPAPVVAVDVPTKVESETYLDGVAGRLRDAGADVRKACIEGRPATRVIEFAHRHGVDLIALSSHGQSGLSGWNVSSVVQKIILRAHISILLVRAYEIASKKLTDLRYRRLMVTLDGSLWAECVLPSATGLAHHYQADVLLTHVVRHPEMPRRGPLSTEDIELTNHVVRRNTSEATRYLEHLHARLSPDISQIRSCLLVAQNAPIALHELVETEGVDLVIISAHGHSGGSRWPYGSVAVSFIVYGNTPLLIVQDLAPDELEKNRPEQVLQELKGH